MRARIQKVWFAAVPADVYVLRGHGVLPLSCLLVPHRTIYAVVMPVTIFGCVVLKEDSDNQWVVGLSMSATLSCRSARCGASG